MDQPTLDDMVLVFLREDGLLPLVRLLDYGYKFLLVLLLTPVHVSFPELFDSPILRLGDVSQVACFLQYTCITYFLTLLQGNNLVHFHEEAGAVKIGFLFVEGLTLLLREADESLKGEYYPTRSLRLEVIADMHSQHIKFVLELSAKQFL